ncbi:HAD-IC family P-type ATPase [Streptomyces globisporus]|uniref:HAD-IC family P-type ATPase n=1 Tax=Streptomyces globisporus TaxID=1908 RepID=UPI0036BFB76B
MDGALLIVIFATSGALEALATARTQDAVRGLLDLAATTATRLSGDGREETVATADLVVGDTVLIRPGERVGADGRVLHGVSDVDQATITGEPLPVAKEAGDEVFAGTLNGSGALRVKVEHLMVTVCRGCCCGILAKVPRLDHAGQFVDLRTSLSGVAMVRRTDCLDACERANVVQPSAEGRKAGGRPVWLGQVNDPAAVADITTWVNSGGPGLADPPGVLDLYTFTPSRRVRRELED